MATKRSLHAEERVGAEQVALELPTVYFARAFAGCLHFVICAESGSWPLCAVAGED